MLDWDEENPAPNLTQIEDKILALRQRMGQSVGGGGGEPRDESAGRKPEMSRCGAEMRYKGQKERRSRAG